MFVWATSCLAQKNLNEVKLSSTLLEEVTPVNLPDVQASLNSKKRAAGLTVMPKLIINERVRIYVPKGHEDVVRIRAITHKETLANWDREVGTSIEMFASTEGGMERYVEEINGDDFEAVSFFTKGELKGKDNYALYRNKEKGIALFIIYETNAPDEVRITNMRNIIKDLKVE